jgi:hypothetical protein
MTPGHPLLEIPTSLKLVSEYIHATHQNPAARRDAALLVLAVVAEWTANEISGEFGDCDETAAALREALAAYFALNDVM